MQPWRLFMGFAAILLLGIYLGSSQRARCPSHLCTHTPLSACHWATLPSHTRTAAIAIHPPCSVYPDPAPQAPTDAKSRILKERLPTDVSGEEVFREIQERWK